MSRAAAAAMKDLALAYMEVSQECGKAEERRLLELHAIVHLRCSERLECKAAEAEAALGPPMPMAEKGKKR